MEAWQFVGLAGAGLAAGYVATLLGVGGGLLMVPVLHYGFGFPFVEATLLSLAAMVVPSALGVIQHHRRSGVDFRLGGWLAFGGAGGVVAGIALQARLPTTALKIVFASLMALAAWRLFLPSLQQERRPAPTAVAGIGFVSGLASRLVGVGGGLVAVPLLNFLGSPIHRAVAASLVAVFTNSLLATVQAAGTSGLHWVTAGTLALAATLATPLGTWTAHRLHPERLRGVFAVALVLAAMAVAFEAFR